MNGAFARHLPVFVALAALGAACSKSRDGVPQPGLSVLALSPPSGTIGVEPHATITLTLAADSIPVTAADLIVTDGSNRLPGTVARVGASDRWVWTPAVHLPRGATIRVATLSQGELGTFVVREIRAGAELTLPGEQVENALSWSNGRQAVRTQSGRVFELRLGASVLFERFVTMPAGARAYGDGRFVGEQEEQGVRYCVRGDLNGALDRVPTPLGVPLGDINAAGDVVALVPGNVGAPAEQGLWRLRRDQAAFELVGPRSWIGVVDRPSIEADGTVSIAWAENGSARLARFVPGSLAGQDFTLALAGPLSRPVSGVHYDASDDGRGVLAFVVSEASAPGAPPTRWVALAARFVPGSGLRPLSTELQSRPIGLTTLTPIFRIEDVVAGDHGSAAVTIASGAAGGGQTSLALSVARVETADVVVEAAPIAQTITAVPPLPVSFTELRASPGRAEVWCVSRFLPSDRVTLTRSRPGGQFSDTLYRFVAGRTYADWSFAFDDSGRGFYAVTESEASGPLLGTRIVLID